MASRVTVAELKGVIAEAEKTYAAALMDAEEMRARLAVLEAKRTSPIAEGKRAALRRELERIEARCASTRERRDRLTGILATAARDHSGAHPVLRPSVDPSGEHPALMPRSVSVQAVRPSAPAPRSIVAAPAPVPAAVVVSPPVAPPPVDRMDAMSTERLGERPTPMAPSAAYGIDGDAPTVRPDGPAKRMPPWMRLLLPDVGGSARGGRIDRFRIERLLGHGSQAVVFLATDQLRRVALKVVDLETVQEAVWRAMWTEAKRLASIRHDHVVIAHGFGLSDANDRDGGRHRVAWLALEYMDGGTIGDLEAAKGSGHPQLLPIRRSAAIVSHAARGVAAIHGADFLHGDIKPSNILLDAAGAVRVADLGVAVEIGLCPDALSGTIGYLAPELIGAHHAGGPLPFSHAVDIYALGSTLYRMITGTTPVRAAAATVDGVCPPWRAFAGRSAVPDPRETRSGLPEAIVEVVMRAVDMDPSRRHRDADELADDLLAALAATDHRRSGSGVVAATGSSVQRGS